MGVRPTYPHAVAIAGGAPALIPLSIDTDILRAHYERLDGLVLSGGGDIAPERYGAAPSPYSTGIDFNRDEIEILLARWAVEDDKPLLAICRGHQVLNVALGGTLIQDIREEVSNALRHDPPTDDWFTILAHEVAIVAGSTLHAALGGERRLAVNSLHHQSVRQVATDLRIVACADDGIVEGIEHPDRRFVVGVQWHPEALVDQHPPMKRLFEELVHSAMASAPEG
jgi:putative glutamine amidotransferase